MNKKTVLGYKILISFVIVFGIVACERDFVNLDSNVITNGNSTNFDIVSQKYNIIATTRRLGPVQTNNISINSMGIYNDAYGTTTSSILTQLSPQTLDPVFGEDTNVLDSVVLTIPYFSIITGVDDNGRNTYELDSIIGDEKIKLSLFESDFFLRDFDPNGEFEDPQAYYSNGSASSTELISQANFESQQILHVDPMSQMTTTADLEITPNNSAIILTIPDDGGVDQVSNVLAPAIRVKLDKAYWQSKVIDLEGEAELSNTNNFFNHLRGLYLKVESASGSTGSYMFLNLNAANANITLHYNRDNTDTEETGDVINETYVLNFGARRVNLFDNNFIINDGDPVNGDEQLFLKGNEGAIAEIKLFDGVEIDGTTTFNKFRTDFANLDENGNFESSKRLINEANLVFFVDRTANPDESQYPERIYLYDFDNKTPLIDFFRDGRTITFPSLSAINHLVPLVEVEEASENVFKYKVRVTEHINGLVLRDSTNVNLGLSISLNVNDEEFIPQSDVQTIGGDQFSAPSSSAATPRGVILHGSNIPNGSPNEDKQVYLEIFFTCIEDDEGCQ